MDQQQTNVIFKIGNDGKVPFSISQTDRWKSENVSALEDGHREKQPKANYFGKDNSVSLELFFTQRSPNFDVTTFQDDLEAAFIDAYRQKAVQKSACLDLLKWTPGLLPVADDLNPEAVSQSVRYLAKDETIFAWTRNCIIRCIAFCTFVKPRLKGSYDLSIISAKDPADQDHYAVIYCWPSFKGWKQCLLLDMNADRIIQLEDKKVVKCSEKNCEVVYSHENHLLISSGGCKYFLDKVCECNDLLPKVVPPTVFNWPFSDPILQVQNQKLFSISKKEEGEEDVLTQIKTKKNLFAFLVKNLESKYHDMLELSIVMSLVWESLSPE